MMKLMDQPRTYKIYTRLINIEIIVNNLLNCEDIQTDYIIHMGIYGFITKYLEYNNPQDDNYSSEMDCHICEILVNLCASEAFKYGQVLIDGGF